MTIWQPCAPPPGLYGNAAFACDGERLFVMGGDAAGTYAPVAAVNAYDPVTGLWTARAPLPVPYASGAAAYVAGKVYYAASFSSSSGMGATVPVWVYDPRNDAAGWSNVHPMPDYTQGLILQGFAGKLYSRDNAGSIMVYDPADDTAGWVSITWPAPIQYSGLAASGSKLYLLGGQTWSYTPLATAYSYDATAGWLPIANLPEAHSFALAAVAVDGRLWCTWGASSVYSYNPADDAAGWRAETALPAVGNGGSLSQIGTFLFYTDTSVAYKISTVPPGVLYPAAVAGRTTTVVDVPGPRSLTPQQVRSGTQVSVRAPALPLLPDTVWSKTWFNSDPELIVTSPFRPETVAGSTNVGVALHPTGWLTSAPMVGSTKLTNGLSEKTFEFADGITLPNAVQPDPPWYVVDKLDSTTGLVKALRPPAISAYGSAYLPWSFTGRAGTGRIWLYSDGPSGVYVGLRENGGWQAYASGTNTYSLPYDFPVADGLNTFTLSFADFSGVGAGATAYIHRIVVPIIPPNSVDLVVVDLRGQLAPAVVAGSTAAVAALTVTRSVTLIPDRVSGRTGVNITAAPRIKTLRPARVAGRTDIAVTVPRYVDLLPDTVFSQTDAQVDWELAHTFALDVAAGYTAVNLAAQMTFTLDPALGYATVTVDLRSVGITPLQPDPVVGFSYVRLVAGYEKSNIGAPIMRNTPILIAFTATAQLDVIEMAVTE